MDDVSNIAGILGNLSIAAGLFLTFFGYMVNSNFWTAIVYEFQGFNFRMSSLVQKKFGDESLRIISADTEVNYPILVEDSDGNRYLVALNQAVFDGNELRYCTENYLNSSIRKSLENWSQVYINIWFFFALPFALAIYLCGGTCYVTTEPLEAETEVWVVIINSEKPVKKGYLKFITQNNLGHYAIFYDNEICYYTYNERPRDAYKYTLSSDVVYQSIQQGGFSFLSCLGKTDNKSVLEKMLIYFYLTRTNEQYRFFLENRRVTFTELLGFYEYWTDTRHEDFYVVTVDQSEIGDSVIILYRRIKFDSIPCVLELRDHRISRLIPLKYHNLDLKRMPVSAELCPYGEIIF